MLLFDQSSNGNRREVNEFAFHLFKFRYHDNYRQTKIIIRNTKIEEINVY